MELIERVVSRIIMRFLKKKSLTLLEKLWNFIEDVEKEGLTNDSWFIDFEDEINRMSIKDHYQLDSMENLSKKSKKGKKNKNKQSNR